MRGTGAQEGRIVLERTEGGTSVLVDGHPQSFVADDPFFLAFEYILYFTIYLSGRPDGPLRLTHVGGAGLTLPRWVEAARPGSPQIVLEPDTGLTDIVRRELPLPRGHRIRVRPLRGAEGVAALKDASADAVVVDAFAAGRVPDELLTPAFAADLARVLAPGGIALVNAPDEPGLRFVARLAATLAEAGLDEQSLVAGHEVLKGKRYGNTVLAATRPGEHPDLTGIVRAAASAPFPTGVRHPGELARMRAGARPASADDPLTHPPAPDPGRWRLR